MKIKLFFIFCFPFTIIFGQQLEDSIYSSIDKFVVNKTNKTLKILLEEEAEFEVSVKTSSEKLALVVLQCNLAYHLKETNQIKQAIGIYEKAWVSYSKNRLSTYDIIEYCLKPLGNLYIKLNDYTNAENIIKQYVFLAKTLGIQKQEIAGGINLSKLYQSIEKHKSVVTLINGILIMPNLTKLQREELEIIKARSLASLGDEVGEVENNYGVDTILTGVNKVYLNYQYAMRNENYIEAEKYFDRFKKNKLSGEVDKRTLAKLFFEEGQLDYLLGKINKARLSLNKALEVLFFKRIAYENLEKSVLYPETTFIDIFDLYAVIEESPEISLRYYGYSFYVAELLEANLTATKSKIIHQYAKRNRSEKCIDILLKLYEKEKEKKYLERAFYYAEKGKSEILEAEKLRSNLLKMHPKDSLLVKEQKLIHKQEVLTNLYSNNKVGRVSNLRTYELAKELNYVSVRLKKVQLQIKEKFTKTNGQSNFKELLQKLKKNKTTLIEYFVGKKTIYQFIISVNGITVNTINDIERKKKEIVRYIQFFNNASIINNDITSFTKVSYNLYKSLNLNELCIQNKLVIIPDGLLHFVPFETLLTKETHSSYYDKMPFLIKKHTVSYSLKSTFLFAERKKRKEKKVLGVFPVFKNTTRELSYTLKEAETVESTFTSVLLKHDKATRENFLKNVEKVSVLHLSTHANAGDFVKEASVEFYDKNVTLSELNVLNLELDLVVLSACETGVGKVEKGEGVMSLARAFNYAGVDNLLFSLWKINDKSTSLIMANFYKSLKKEKNVNVANKQSKLEYLKSTNIANQKKSPYYWGAFVYYGTIEETTESMNLLVKLGLISLIIISLSLMFYKLKIKK
ncbi:CHAT domain-containing protein [Tenacibaculum sp. nBUS_03]|uniref:CHAT domain-containing protein n=1 Tax=Tenacibaculum sp. nBUS_03 TaxID=3395320 RepID=UPI003EBCC84D